MNRYYKPDLAPAQPVQELWETRKKDITALFLIQLALDDEFTP